MYFLQKSIFLTITDILIYYLFFKSMLVLLLSIIIFKTAAKKHDVPTTVVENCNYLIIKSCRKKNIFLFALLDVNMYLGNHHNRL